MEAGSTGPSLGFGDDEQRERLARAIEREGLRPGQPFACPYLPMRSARYLTVIPAPLGPGVYQALLDLNFRRLGPVFYQPRCGSCTECRTIRVPVARFHPSRSQRRCWARNADLSIEVGSPRPTEEKRRLYKRYLESRHDGQMDGSPGEFYGFLYASDIETLEVVYRAGERVVGVGIADAEPRAMSAVYSYFDPDESGRSPGVFNILWLIEECRRRSLPHLYLGYYVRGCRRMSYKASYRPFEILGLDGRWT